MSTDNSGGGIIKKVLLAFALGTGAVVITLSISYFGLNKMLTVVYDLGTPNEKLKTLNNLYRKAAALNDQQRIDAIRNPNKPDRDFLEESNELLIILDSLISMQWKDTVQVYRLRQMKTIIQKRNNLFLSYLRLRSNVIKDKVMARKFDSLSEMLSKENITADTSVRTSEKKSTTITYVQDTTATEGQKRSFFSKLFKKRPGPESVPLPDRTVTEEVQVTVDTIAVAQTNKKLAEASKLIDQLGMSQINTRRKLADRELELLATSRELFSELVGIVHTVEVEELEGVRVNNDAALDVVDESSGVIVAILLIFSMMAAALIYLIAIDVTRSNFYRAGLIREKERAEELSQVKERFLSNMSHEIRTPLQTIIGYSEQLRLNPLADADTAIKAISNSSEHLLHIVNEVLDYSRLESGKIEFEKKEFYPLEIAEEVASAVRVQAEKKGLDLIFDTTMASNELAEGDEFRLRQILYNLLGNAVKFTSKGQVKLNVSGVADKQTLKMKFEISDTGIGIREKDLERIFHRFEQASAEVGNTHGGTGLGLTIVKMLVEGQGGSINVKSAEGKGSSFVVELSYALKASPSTVVKPVRSVAPRDIRVLVLDDDRAIVELCGLMLSNVNVPFETHPNPEELFKHNIAPNITHILMDIRMGNVNGVDLHRSLKKRLKGAVKIFAMTAIAQGNLDQFDGVLRKPFRAEDLYRLLGAEDRFSVVRKMTNNDDELFKSVLADFVGETNKDVLLVEKAINEEQDKELLLLVHRLAGRTNQFGFSGLSSSLRQIEKDLESGVTADKLKNRWAQLREDIHAALLTI
jgi:signal transduction histidine kinase/FixJ family two-component response regulator